MLHGHHAIGVDREDGETEAGTAKVLTGLKHRVVLCL
jgi:hypothetical protein